jgi:hypothetical protein
MASNQNMNQNRALAGLNTDNIISQIQEGYVTDALNAINGSFDGHQVTYQNEEGNVHCVTMPTGYKCIGVKNIMQIAQVWYFITNPSTGYSMIGYVASNTCDFVPVIDDSIFGSDLLNFNIAYPIHKVEVKTTNCSTQLYWTDKYNHRRFIDINNLPWQTGSPGVLDTNLMEIQPLFKIPNITPTSITIGGNLREGSYQFAIQYASIKGEGLTSWYSVTNPVRIFLESKISADYNLQTNYAIPLTISNLDTTRLYSYFNLAVIKTINAVTTVELVGTYYIQTDVYNHTYTGDEESGVNIQLTLSEIMLQNDYYDIAGDLTQVDNTLVWADMIKEEDISYQKIFNQVKVHWGTSQMPVGQTIGYHNGVNCAEAEGYFRDEVYALEGCLIFNNGKQSTRCHIPGRIATAYDLQYISNADEQAVATATCPTSLTPRWKVYNTGSVIGSLSGSADPCTGIRPWQYGEMSYWESEELYPNNTAIWGSLAGQPIRHHKFPDCTISPIHDSAVSPNVNIGFNPGYVYPIGFKIDIHSLYSAIINSTDLTEAEKRSIVGFKIMRSDRAGERSIIAKGLFYNIGQYDKDGSTYFYPNYPLNDVNPDVFISSKPVTSSPYTWSHKITGNTDNAEANRLNNFQNSRFTFHSPDTHFYQPSGIQDSLINLETAEYGTCKAHFVKVKNNAGEKIRTINALEIALAAGLVSCVGIDINVSQATTVGTTNDTTTTVDIRPAFNPQNFFPTYNSMLEILDKLSPYYNYGWQYNAVGYYTNSVPIPQNVGNKVRFIKYGGYITPGLQGTFGDTYPINNTGRESSVYVSLSNGLPYTHQQVDINGNNLNIPIDTSRQIASKVNREQSSTPFYESISAYYGSIKAIRPAQYGQVFSYRPIDTGTFGVFLDPQGKPINDHPIVYGGDCFINLFALKIKHPFYLKSTVDKPDGFDIDYNQDADPNNTSQAYTNTGNVGYPIWYYSTSNLPFVQNALLHGGLVNTNNTLNFLNGLYSSIGAPGSNLFTNVFNVIAALVGTVVIIPILVLEILEIFVGLITSNLLTNVGLKVTNLDYYRHDDIYEKGMAYLYAYGIPYFFCESQVNVDMRQAYNDKEGNFYPNVATDIPDEWLQETNVPIAFDNTYTYNKTYSKQNHETAFTTLRPDWEPGQQCYITYNNRAVWSEASDMEDTRNNWLVYKPANTFDFPKSFGALIAIDRLESRAVMVRYVNHTQLYNAQATIETTAINAALGTGALFSGTQPIDFTMSDSGYAGTQHKFILQTENGHIFADAMRGQVIIVKGTAVEELSSPKYLNSKWFQTNLPFNIIKSFPTYPIDNNFNGCGLHGVYDDFYKRFIITKIDYVPYEGVKYDGTNFYIEKTVIVNGESEGYHPVTCCPPGTSFAIVSVSPMFPNGIACEGSSGVTSTIQCDDVIGVSGTYTCCPEGYIYLTPPGKDPVCYEPVNVLKTSPIQCPSISETGSEKIIVTLGDPKYFCNKSWTMSFSFLSNSWISWHSYIPNFYVQNTVAFQSGKNDDTCTVWNHNQTFTLFNNFYAQDFPYIIEYPFSYQYLDQLLQYVEEYMTVLKYDEEGIYIEPDETIYFTQVIVYNKQASTGLLNLIPKDINNRAQYFSYPKYNPSSIDILVTKVDHMYSYNMLWNNLKSPNLTQWANNCTPELGSKTLNQVNFDYSTKSFQKYPLRAKDTLIRQMSNRTLMPYKMISKFIVAKTQNMIS